MSLHEVTFRVDRVKVEHVGRTLRLLYLVERALAAEGLDLGFSCSVERDRDGVERWTDWIDDEGKIKDIQPWEVTA